MVGNPQAMMQATTHAEFACRAAAASLRALRPLMAASQAVAIVAGVWLLNARTSICLVASFTVWAAGLYLAVRVYLDAELLELLAADPESHPDKLDQFLIQAGLRRQPVKRSIEGRCHGSLLLAKGLVVAFVAQVAFMVAFMAAEVARSTR